MRPGLRNRPLLAYLFAVLVSAVALGVVLGSEAVVGYIPLLFLAFVAVVEAYAGPVRHCLAWQSALRARCFS